MNIEKAKDKARKFEQKEQFEKAIDLYGKVIEALEGTPEFDNELGLFNKLGDLHIKIGNVGAAVELYERAANRYAEQGFPNNAIALCNKILRASPGRIPVYLKLAKLMVERGFLAEAKRHLLEYAQRMQESGKLEEAFVALKEFADLSPNSEEIRLILAEQLKQAARTDEAREQLAKLYAEVEAAGDQRKTRATIERMKAIDPEFDAESEPKAKVKKKRNQKSSDLIFLDLDVVEVGEEEEEPEKDAAPVEEADPAPEVAVAADPADDLEIETTVLADEGEAEVVDAPGLEIEPTGLGGEADEGGEEATAVDFETTSLADDVDEEPDVAGVAEPADMERTSTMDLESIDEIDKVDAPTDLERHSIAASEIQMDELPDTPDDLERTSLVEEASEVAGDENVIVVEGQTISLDEQDSSQGVETPDVAIDEGADLAIADLEIEEDVGEPVPAHAGDTGNESFEVADLDLDQSLSSDTESDLALDVPELEVADLELEDVSAEPQEGLKPESGGFDLGAAIAADLDDDASAVEIVDVATLEAQVADDPENAVLHRQLAESLLEAGDRTRGFQELDVAIELFEQQEEWTTAESVASEALRLEPNSVKYHQKQVEYAFRRGEHDGLIGAYLGLADALFRDGSTDRARAVYVRILERDPGNERAKLAIDTLTPVEEVPAAPAEPEPAAAQPAEKSDYVDLGALLFEDEIGPKKKMDTRMRIKDEEPTGDEEKDFAEMLSAFKKGIEENLADDDWQAHYDLGVAFKEMGLLDEAITEFQKALRSGQSRLRTAESLGLCFFEKGQFSVAGTVLRRAIESESGSDEAKIALLYWLGRSEEEQAHEAPALQCYQRVFSVDIGFEDVQERVKALAGAAGK